MAASATVKAVKSAAPAFKQYRESDGQFYFKLLDAKGQLLLQSTGFSAPREAAQSVSRLQKEGPAALQALVGVLALQADPAAVNAALIQLAQAPE